MASDPDGAGTNLFRLDRSIGVLTRHPLAATSASGDGKIVISGSLVVDLDTGVSTPLSSTIYVPFGRMNGDGRFVAFYAASVPGIYPGGSHTQVFVLDRTTGTAELVSRAADGTPGNASAYSDFAISDDGRIVAFSAAASNLVPGDTNGVRDVFVHDRVTQVTTRVSVLEGGGQRTYDSLKPALSGDGRVVVFETGTTPACGTCPSLNRLLLAYDRLTGAISQVNVSTDGTPSGEEPVFTGLPTLLDATGRYVVFESADGSLAAGDVNQAGDTFRRDLGPVGCTYGASPSVVDATASGTALVVDVRAATGCPWTGGTASSWLSLSAASGTGPGSSTLTIAPNGGVSRFGYAWVAGARVFVSQPGALAATPLAFERVEPLPTTGSPRNLSFAVMSDEGRYVAFAAVVEQHPQAGPRHRVVLSDRQTGQRIDVSAQPGGPAAEPGMSHTLHQLSGDGRHLLFSTMPLNPSTTTPACFAYDRLAGTTSVVPADVGTGSGGPCPAMSRDGRFFAGRGTGSAAALSAIRIVDRATGQLRVTPVPGLTSNHQLSGPDLVSNDGRYTVSRVKYTPPGCFKSSCESIYWVLLDTVAGTARQSAPTTSFHEVSYLRAKLIDLEWEAFGLPRHDARLTPPQLCELVDRRTGAVTDLSALANLRADCGPVVNDGRQVLVRSGLPLTPGSRFLNNPSLFVYTVATGRVDRIASLPEGDEFQAGFASVSANGRWLLVMAVTGPADAPLVTQLVLDLGVTTAPPGTEPVTDTDADGLPDAWEIRYGLDPTLPNALLDADGDGSTNAAEFAAGTHPRGTHVRYFGEGATSAFFRSRLALLNAGTSPAKVLLQFQLGSGVVVPHFVDVPARTRRTVDVGDLPGLQQAEFATVIESDVPVLADRTMTWDASGYGSHAESSVAVPRTLWFLAEGATHSGLELFYLLQNPSAVPAVVTIEYLLPAPAAPITRDYQVGARSRFTIWVDQDDPRLFSTDVSARITSSAPIIVERAMYLSREQTFGAGHNSAAIAAPATRWFFAEGATGAYFDLFLLVANPANDPAEIRATYLLPSGTTLTRSYVVAPRSRFNIWVDLEDARLADTAVSTVLESVNGVAVIAERAMWWPGNRAGGWFEAHNSAGTTETGTAWGVAEGESGGASAIETYLLVANTSAFDTTVVTTLLFEDGTSAARTFTVPASSRFNVSVASEFPAAQGRRFGAIVESTGATPGQIVVERAMYSNAGGMAWAAGTNALAARLR